MNQDNDYKSATAFSKLSNFRSHAFKAFGKHAEFSDAVWFPTWSGKSVGGRLARVILNDSPFEAISLIIRVALETFIQGVLRCRVPIFFLPPNWISEQTLSVLQTWRDCKSANDAPPAFQDKFFGDFFKGPYSENRLSFINFVTDNIPDKFQSPSFLVGRSSKVRLCHVQTIFEMTQVLLCNVPGAFRMMWSVPGTVQKLACLVIWFGIANQRSRHAFALFQFLSRNVAPVLASLSKPPTLYLPYETHPEQNALAAFWSESGGHSVGYVHGTMLTFPAHYLRPLLGAVDSILCHGSVYPNLLSQLGWNKAHVKRIKSLRFSKSRAANQQPAPGSVYFPYWSGDLSFAITQIEKGKKAGLLSIQTLKPHPATGLSKMSQSRFEKITDESPDQVHKKPDQIISIGPVSVPLEELERGSKFEVLHVPISDAPWDSFSADIWSAYLDVEPIAKYIYVYRIKLKQPGAFIDFDG